MLGTRAVMLLGPEAIGVALANRDKSFANKKGWEYFIGPFFHRGVMLMDFAEHHHHLRIMQQAFTRDRLVGYLDAMNPGIERGLAQWRPGQRFPLYTEAKQLTLDLATESEQRALSQRPPGRGCTSDHRAGRPPPRLRQAGELVRLSEWPLPKIGHAVTDPGETPMRPAPP